MIKIIIKKQFNISRNKYVSTTTKLLNSCHLTTKEKLSKIIRKSLILSYGDDIGLNIDTFLAPNKEEFGEYQCNAALHLAKQLKLKPKEIAEKLQNNINIDNIIKSISISGPGFINIKLSELYIQNKIIKILKDPNRLGINKVDNPKKIIVDFSSPNIAKEMHVGHLRSTIIGDSISRILEFKGHNIIRLNHVGDWGTQFGMLITYLKKLYPELSNNNIDDVALNNNNHYLEIGNLVELYKAAKKEFDNNIDFQKQSRFEVVQLQSGNIHSLKLWEKICNISRIEFQSLYNLLDIEIEERGESFYNKMLESLVNELIEKGIAIESNGALCIFVPGYINKQNEPQPIIIKKSDGGYLYSTTDLAAIYQRILIEKADRILYVTDVGQALHFEMIFKAAKLDKKINNNLELTHIPFGLVQGEDGKKFKTRSGETIKLKDLLHEAIKIATEDMANRKLIANNNTNVDKSEDISNILTELEIEAAKIIGISSVKYADLSMHRESNYKFSFKIMLSLNGNTAPYMLYVYARIQSIKMKLFQESLNDSINNDLYEKKIRNIKSEEILLITAEELALAKQLIKLDEYILEIENDFYPNKLCDYIYELSQKFNKFYESCPIMKAETDNIKKSRTVLCYVTSDTLRISLGLLGIKTVEKL